MILSLLALIIAYLVGSVCSAIVVSGLFGLPDPREEGSKNPGATNVLRIAGKKYASIVLLVDILKGTLALLIAKAFGLDPFVLSLTALAVVIGHIYPIYFRFEGGKGVATVIGALLGFNFIVGVMAIATWLLIANFSRFSSLASIVMVIFAPFFSSMVLQEIDIFPPLSFITLLVLYKHRENISRLIDGTEPKINLKKNILQEAMDRFSTEPAANEAHIIPPEEQDSPKAKKTTPIKRKTAKTKEPQTVVKVSPIKSSVKKTETKETKAPKTTKKPKTVKKTEPKEKK